MRRLLMMFSALVVVGLVGFVTTAHAVTTLTLFDGTTTVTVSDGSPLDSNPLANAVTYIGGVGSGPWNSNSNVTTGVRDGGKLILTSIDRSTSGSAHLTITLSDDFSQIITGFNFAVGGTLGSTTTGAATFAGQENSTPFATLGPYSPVGFNGHTSGSLALTGSYNLEIVADIDHPATGLTSFGAQLSTTPLPGTLLLLGTGLVSLATYARRRQHA